MKVPLNGGAYKARSLVASAQRQLNLYSEPLPQSTGEPSLVALYPTPGLTLLTTLPTGPVRAIRQASTGQIYAVGGAWVYQLDPVSWAATALGTITPGLTTPVSMQDNTQQMVLVDGTANGWTIDLTTNILAPLVDATGTFRGADRVSYLDTFLLFNVPDTPQFMASNSLATAFNPLWFANKSAQPDILVTLVVARREIWLLGARTTEVFYNTGAADFPFQSMAGVFVAHGCCARYSACEIDNSVYWLSQDAQGQGLVLRSQGYTAERISTFAIEAELASYATLADAIGWSYQLGGHTCYVLTFPTADRTWVYDVSTGLWHEWGWLDGDGGERRHRGNCAYAVNGVPVVGDWQTGAIYQIDSTALTDAGAPIKRQRGFPHMMGPDLRRMFFRQFVADIQTGTLPVSMTDDPPLIYLDWSDDRGASYGNAVAQSLGAAGEGRLLVQWQRLGMARDRVFRLTWSTPAETVLLGAFVDASASQT